MKFFVDTAQNMKSSIKNFFGMCDQICSLLNSKLDFFELGDMCLLALCINNTPSLMYSQSHRFSSRIFTKKSLMVQF